MILIGVWSLNEYTNGDFGRVIAGLFPREIETLGLKKVLEQVKK